MKNNAPTPFPMVNQLLINSPAKSWKSKLIGLLSNGIKFHKIIKLKTSIKRKKMLNQFMKKFSHILVLVKVKKYLQLYSKSLMKTDKCQPCSLMVSPWWMEWNAPAALLKLVKPMIFTWSILLLILILSISIS